MPKMCDTKVFLFYVIMNEIMSTNFLSPKFIIVKEEKVCDVAKGYIDVYGRT